MTTQSQPTWVKEAFRTIGVAVVSYINQKRLEDTKSYTIELSLPSQMPALPSGRNMIQERLFGKPALSLLELDQAFKRIADAPHIREVLLKMSGFAMPLADLTALRDSILRLRKAGKRVTAYAQGYDNATYYVASACDAIWLQRGGMLVTTGLLRQQVFLKNALESVGVAFDSVAISPFKSATDALTRTEPSPETDAQTNWLLDSTYEVFTQAIANGRNVSLDAVHAMINTAPHTDTQAKEAVYVDALCNEEDFSRLLDGETIVMWEEATNRLPLRVAIAPDAVIAVLPLTGTIYNGKSSDQPIDIPLPIVGDDRLGDVTVVQQIRILMKMDTVKAVVLYIDSPGGSATASEAIASALDELAKKMPVVACMGGVAASGGYYIATSADYIIAQPTTITGSIGVITAKLVNTDTLKKLRLNPFYYLRGQNADIFAPINAFTEEQRAKVVASIQSIYDVFIERVANARKMKPESVDAIGGGRVWTGAQALENGLVDELGGLHEAVNKARELAKLPKDTPIFIQRAPQGTPLVAQLAEKVNPAAAVRYWLNNLTELTKGQALLLLPSEWRD